MIKQLKIMVTKFKRWYTKVTCKHDGRIVDYFPYNNVYWKNGENGGKASCIKFEGCLKCGQVKVKNYGD